MAKAEATPPESGPWWEAVEPALVARARSEPREFGPLYDRYAERVYRYCRRRLGSREAAEDATAQTFARALSGLPRYRGGSFPAWLFAIAHNVCANARRDARADRPLETAGEVADAAPSPEELAVATDDDRAVRALLAALPADQRRVVELRLAGLTGAEIAETLGRSLASVKMLQVRALARLRAAHAATTGGGDHRERA